MSKEIELGDKVKDEISGLTGIVYQIAECLHGCRRIQIECDTLKPDGTPQDGWWMDEHRLKVIKKGVIKSLSKEEPTVKPGGPNVRVPR